MRSNPIKNTEDIGRFIRETRKKQKLTQRDLASLMGAVDVYCVGCICQTNMPSKNLGKTFRKNAHNRPFVLNFL
jgi:transcriptional regulator with XRE-family HTH domain